MYESSLQIAANLSANEAITIGGLLQTFTFSSERHVVTFNGSDDGSQDGQLLVKVNVPSSSIKWTIAINTSSPLTDVLTMTYSLNDLTSLLNNNASSRPVNFNSSNVIKSSSSGLVTTYYLPLPSSTLSSSPSLSSSGELLVAILEVVEVALVDRFKLVAVKNSILVEDTGKYLLVLEFPPFNQSLEFDPSLGLGVLLNDQSSNGGSSDNLAVIIGVSVALPLACVLVVVAITISTMLLYLKRRRSKAHRARMSAVMMQRMEIHHSN